MPPHRLLRPDSFVIYIFFTMTLRRLLIFDISRINCTKLLKHL